MRLVRDVAAWRGTLTVPAGTTGVVVDVYTNPVGYALDVVVNGEENNITVPADAVELAE
ncbi:MAG TPA: hypothetical protein VHX59_02900 [Mycobacteriales bacterium]|nr:hypothetical protein [Mycobacteriales bacterium]